MLTVILPPNLGTSLNIHYNKSLLVEGNDYEVWLTNSNNPSVIKSIQIVEFKINVNLNDSIDIADNTIQLYYQFNGNDLVLIGSNKILYNNSNNTTNIIPEPKNNEGRKICFWCNSTTKKIQGFVSTYDYCESCKR